MSNRNFHQVKAQRRNQVLIAGSFTTTGAGAVDAQVPANAAGFTVTKPAGTGIYRITLDDPYNAIESAVACVFGASALDATVQTQVKTASTGVIDVLVKTGSTGAALDLLSGGVEFMIMVKDSSVAG